MMQIGVVTRGMEEVLGIDGTYKMIRECGFDAADATLYNLFPPEAIGRGQHAAVFDCASDQESMTYFRPWKEAAQKYGVDNYQAHAICPTYIARFGPEYDDYLLKALKRNIIGCDFIGCHKLVVHPFFLEYSRQLSPKDEWELNIERYSALIPAAKQYGVTILLENMFSEHRGKIISACCSDIEEACRYIDTLNEIAGEKVFAFCLDTGHLHLVGQDVKNAMTQLSHRIEAFHIHDNNGLEDEHIAPFFGTADYDRFIEGLRAIRYEGTLNFEVTKVWRTVDHELCPTVMRFIAEAGRMFARRAQG